MQLLVNSFNASAAEGVMCRGTVSVGWDGRIYDCDFNQQLEMGLRLGFMHTVAVRIVHHSRLSVNLIGGCKTALALAGALLRPEGIVNSTLWCAGFLDMTRSRD